MFASSLHLTDEQVPLFLSLNSKLKKVVSFGLIGGQHIMA